MARVMEIRTALGDNVLLFKSMTASEELGRLFDYQIEALGDKNNIASNDILGKDATVKLELPDGGWRYFSGYVTRFGMAGTHGRHFLYRIVMRPWLWFLTRSSDCRIFQGMTAPAIIKEIFNKYSNAAFEDRLTNTYRTREYCVQYRESDFDFISRLMEEEGIYYYFQHAENKHTAVLADSASAHNPCPGYEEITFIPQDRNLRQEQECISDWLFSNEIESGKYVLDEFDFKKPSTDLQVRSKLERKHAESNHEQFDYPGDYVTAGEGDHYARTRLEELQAGHELATATANTRGLLVGGLFKLIKQARSDQNRQYLVVSANYQLDVNEYEAQAGTGASFTCGFTAMQSKEVFRPRRTTPRAIVRGPQTAIVVGPSGDEIYTDNFGRVKVQFHWDRYGQSNENSSCWVRVSHPWAGKNWGMVAIPRIGQEVVVDFLEGNPDQPMIIGRVYNAEQMPPYELPANKTQTGIKTRSSTGGSPANFNEIRFEDKKGSEQLFIHAEKNQDIEVENDETHWVGNDRKKSVDNDETVNIGNNRTETVGVDESITIGANRTESVGANESISIGASRDETVAASESISIGATRSKTVGASETVNIGGSQTISVGGSLTETVGGSLTQSVGGGITISTPGTFTVNATGGYTVIAPGGTKTIDSWFTKIGGKEEDLFAIQSAILSIQNTVCLVLSTQMQTTKIDITGFTFERCGVKSANEPLTIQQASTKLKQGALGLYMYGITLIN